jgi:hypothetical protein
LINIVIEGAIRLLDQPANTPVFGDILETAAIVGNPR